MRVIWGELGDIKYGEVADAIEAFLRELREGRVFNPGRTEHVVGRGWLGLMPAAGRGFMGVKVVTVFEENARKGVPVVQATYVLMDGSTGMPMAVMDGAFLTAVRTPAATLVAARRFSRGAETLVVIGAGVQGRGHALAFVEDIGVSRVFVWSRGVDSAVRLARLLGDRGVDAEVRRPEEACPLADAVVTATTSREPVLRGRWLREGAAVYAVGAYLPDARELDDRVFEKASLVVADSEGALEAGDLRIPLDKGVLRRGDIRFLWEVLETGDVGGTVVYKSVGNAVFDLAAATLVWEKYGAGKGGQ